MSEPLLQLCNKRLDSIRRIQQEAVNLIEKNKPYPKSYETELLITIQEMLSEQR